MMDPILGAFEERLRGVAFTPRAFPISPMSPAHGSSRRKPPTLPIGRATSARRFVSATILPSCSARLIASSLKPDRATCSLRWLASRAAPSAKAFPSLAASARNRLPRCAARLKLSASSWTLGVNVDWSKLHAPDSVQRIPLPTYPFERQKFWIEPDKVAPASIPAPAPATATKAEGGISLYRRIWKPVALPRGRNRAGALAHLQRLARRRRSDRPATQGGKAGVVVVEAGNARAAEAWALHAASPSGPTTTLSSPAFLNPGRRHAKSSTCVLWQRETPPVARKTLDRSFLSPLYLAQALAAQDLSGIDIALVSNHMQQVAEEPVRHPARAVLLGPARVLNKELPGFAAKAIDLDFDGGDAAECAARSSPR